MAKKKKEKGVVQSASKKKVKSELLWILKERKKKYGTEESSLSLKKITKKLNKEKEEYEAWNEKNVQKVLKKLVKRGKVIISTELVVPPADGKNNNNPLPTNTETYTIAPSTNDENPNNFSSSSYEKRDGKKSKMSYDIKSSTYEDGTKQAVLPVAELMRRRTTVVQKEDNDDKKPNQTKNTIVSDSQTITATTTIKKQESTTTSALWNMDDEISRLEKELAAYSSNDDSNDDDADNDEDDDHKIGEKKRKISFGVDTVIQYDDENSDNKRRNKENNLLPDIEDTDGGIICLSEFAEERIQPLPSSALPKCKSKKLKIDREGNDTDNKEQRKDDIINNGLRDAVKEILAGYTARSSEKIPFYCRVCSHQSANATEFMTHKQTEMHRLAVQMEKKASYCNLCRKQFTSIIQMQDHLKSKPHKDKLAYMKRSKQYQTGVAKCIPVPPKSRRKYI